MPADNKIRQQVQDIRKAIAAKRTERAEAMKRLEAAKEAFAGSGLDPASATDSPEFLEAKEAMAAVGTLDDAIADLQATEREVLGLLGGSDDPPFNGGGSGGPVAGQALDVRGLFRGAEYEGLKSYAGSRARFGSVVLGQLASAEQTAQMIATGGAAIMAAPVGTDTHEFQGAMPADRRGIIQPNLRPLRLLDLFTFGTTDASVVEYVQVLTVPNQAAEVAQGDLKPEASFTTRDEEAPARTIAVWIKAKRQALADVGMLEALIRNLLTQDVRRRLEDQMVAGDGEDDNILGIKNVTGLGIPDVVAGDNVADAILRAITTVYLSEGEPNFVALHPSTWQELLLMRENQAERTGAYLYGSPAMVAAPTIWGITVVNTKAVTPDRPLVGDTSAATPLVREGLTVRVSDSDQDDFVRNRVTILVEMRVAFPIWRPTSFAEGQVDIPETS